jgi:hypothetical protein
MANVAKQILVKWRLNGGSIGKDNDKNGNIFEYPIVDASTIKLLDSHEITDTVNRMLKTDCRNAANADKGIEARVKTIYASPKVSAEDKDRLGKAYFTRTELPKAVCDEIEAKYSIE